MQNTPTLGAAALTALWFLAGCDAAVVGVEQDPRPAPDFRDAPRPVDDDIGTRTFGTVPNYSAPICPDGTDCTTADVNRDGRMDIVRFDRTGVYNGPGTVSVAYSNGYNFGPMQPVAADACLEGDGCFAADVTGDGLPDLIRFANGPQTQLWVSKAFEEGFAKPKLWSTTFCGPGQTCTAGDVTGDGITDLVAFADKTKDQPAGVFVLPGGDDTPTPELWLQDVCAGKHSTCRLGDIDGDGRVDVVEFLQDDKNSLVRVAKSTGEGFVNPEVWSTENPKHLVCPPGATCQLSDFNGDFAADVIATFSDVPEPGPGSCVGQCGGSAGTCWCDEVCTQYGDCCEDYESACQGLALDHQIHVWHSAEGQFLEAEVMLQMPCGPGDRCWSADVTGDGRSDLITVDPEGLLELFPSRDGIGRMRDAAWRLSMLRSDFAYRQTHWRRREIDDLIAEALPVSPELAALLPDRFPNDVPDASPTVSDPALPIAALPGNEPWPAWAPGTIDGTWSSARMTTLSNTIQTEAQAILDAVPDEDTLTDPAAQRRWRAALGQVVAARTSLYAPPLAASSVTRNVCHNGVLHDRSDEAGALRAEGSYIARFYDAMLVHDEDDRIWAALPALTGIVEGMRCLSEPELAGLEAAFIDAVVATMQDLLDRDQPMLAELIWDEALPVELLLFDGVKSFVPPQGWRLLQARIEAGSVELPDLPAPGSDFGAFFVEDGSTCATVRCQLYKSPRRVTSSGRLLSLDSLGVWLPDLTTRERLRRSSMYPEALLDAMVDLRRLGEGDCALIELNRFNLTCKSRRTCQFAEELAALPNDLGLDLFPGAPGSPHTHLGTVRADLDTANACGLEAGSGGGAPPPTSCIGPEMRGHAGRFAPLDPELDRIMSCTLESFTTETAITELVVADLDFDPDCLLMDPPKPEDPSPPTEEPPEATAEVLTDGFNAARQFLETGDGPAALHGYDREHFISVIMTNTGATHDEVVAAMNWVAQNPMGATAAIGSTDIKNPLQTRVRLAPDGSIDSMQLEVNQEELNYDLAILDDGVLPLETLVNEYIIRGMLHEATHMVLHRLSDMGAAPSIDYLHPKHHDITDSLGLTRVGQSCTAESNQCRSGCGFSDARMSRFTECIEQPDPSPFDRCEVDQDYCEDRRDGTMHYDAGLACGAPTISFPPICAVVQCDAGSAVASACCGGVDPSTGGEPPPYPFEDPSPGPHPGDPDGPWGGIPGGPGGIPFPPLPPPAF